MILLTEGEMKQCEEDARRVSTVDMTCPIDYYWLKRNVAKAQLRKVAEWIKNQPTDGWDKWYFYNKDLAQSLLKEIQ